MGPEVLAIIAVIKNLTTIAAGIAQKENYTPEQLAEIDNELKDSQDRLQEIYDRAEANE